LVFEGEIDIFPIFHVALPLIIFEIPYLKKNYRINRLSLIIGSLLPDFIDKPLELLGISSGRGYFHNLLFAGISFAIVYILSKKNNAISFPFLFGIIIHLLLDMPIPIFYPFIQYEFVPIHKNPVEYWANNLTKSIIYLLSEIIGIIIIIFIIINNKLYSKSKILSYLRTIKRKNVHDFLSIDSS